jgi:integrase
VRTAAAYLGESSPTAHRHQTAEYDHSWVAAGINHAQVLARIRAICPYVAIQTEFSRLFGVRPREARCLRPHEGVIAKVDVVARDVDPLSAATHYLYLAQGTKGGRPRALPVESAEQWDLVRRAQALVAPGHHLGRPDYSLKQNTSHYYRILAQVGICRGESGVTAHGLRHEFAIAEYEKQAGGAAPVRKGVAADPQGDAASRRRVSRLLGHNRPAIASCYLGSPRVAPSPANTEPREDEASR